MARTNASNLFSTELTAEMNATALTAAVLSTSGGPASPALLVVDPPEDATTAARSEIILFDGTFTGTSFVTSNLANRYLQGSAAPSGIVHPVGAKVISAPLGTQLEDLWDEIESHDSGSGAHGATSSPTASTIMARDSNSRSQVATPAVSNDAANKGYVDTHANLTSPHSATSAATSSRLVVRDGSGRAQFASPSASADAATRGWIEGLFPPAEAAFSSFSFTGSNETFAAASTACSLTFTSSRSGNALVTVWGRGRCNSGTNPVLYLSPEVFEGTSAAGTQRLAPSQPDRSATFAGVSTAFTHNEFTILVTGLTPMVTHFARVMHSMVNPGQLEVARRRITVTPVP